VAGAPYQRQEIFFDPSFSPGVNTADDFIRVKVDQMQDAAG
jgi:hypothetical protein